MTHETTRNRVTWSCARRRGQLGFRRASTMVFSCNFWDRLLWLCQRVCAQQCSLMATFRQVSLNRLGGFDGGALGPWRKVLSRSCTTAAVADEVDDPIRIDPVERATLISLRPSSWCKAGRDVGVTINWHGAFRRAKQRRCAQPSSTSRCAGVAAAQWYIDLNPMNDLG